MTSAEVATRIVVGISGSSGAIYGARLIEVLAARPDVECHLVMSKAARMTIGFETDYDAAQVEAWADVVYDERDVGASIASGTCRVDGMIVAPCSIKTLSHIANSNSESLLTRAADVTLKERRRLVLVVRETPLHRGHLELMLKATDAGAVILPPVPGFYIRPATIGDLVDHTITKVLDLFDIDANLVPRWTGLPPDALES
ncbi:MAG: UbiX family flavin prenyltransferase [Acidimicrobiales bacterium]